MARRSSLRASDADRERVAERLREAATEGRLLAHELEERLARALRAVTYGDLDAVVEDLPRALEPRPRRSGPRGAFALARRYPLPAGIVAFTLAITTLTLMAAVAAIALSGVWILPVVLFMIVRGRGFSRGRRGRGGPPWGGGRGRGSVHMHVHRW